jgi:hypothetical protein
MQAHGGAIVNIIAQLVAEGHTLLSLGGTYGCRLETCQDADADIDRVLDELHRQKIFNDDGNLQFKNKFRPDNRSVYLCRAAGSGRADNIVDIINNIIHIIPPRPQINGHFSPFDIVPRYVYDHQHVKYSLITITNSSMDFTILYRYPMTMTFAAHSFWDLLCFPIGVFISINNPCHPCDGTNNIKSATPATTPSIFNLTPSRIERRRPLGT